MLAILIWFPPKYIYNITNILSTYKKCYWEKNIFKQRVQPSKFLNFLTVLLSIPFHKLPWDQYDTGHSRHYQVVFLTASPLRGPIPTVIGLHLSPYYGMAPPGGITWNQSTTITWYFHIFLGYVLLDIFPTFWSLTIFRRMTISKGIACLAGLTVVWYCALLSTHLRARPWYDAT